MLKKLFALLIIYFFLFSIAKSDKIQEIDIKGNFRVSNETIIMFSNLEIGDEYNSNLLNNALKELYYTNYFKDVSITSDNGKILISVIENPIIQSVKLIGIERKKLKEAVKEVTNKIEKYPFVESKINDQVALIKNILKSNGYYFVDLETSINNNDNNTVDLIYDIKLGEIAKIKKISFIGNKIFRDNTLRNIIISEETKFWKFLTSNKYLDTNRINADVFKLNEFYKNRGYFDAKIKSTTAVINERNQFELIFNINAGEKFFFNEIKITNYDDELEMNMKTFENTFKDLKGKKYSAKLIQNLMEELNRSILLNNFVFLNANYKEIVKKDNKIDISITFDDLEKVYVERINILGNFITDEKVVRNKLIVDEGDPFNDILFNKSIQKVKALNIFKSVDYNIKTEENSNKNIDIIVEEKPTGEIFAGVGTGTTGNSLTAGVKENNYLGLGIKLDTNFTLSDDSVKGKFSVINPNYNNSDKSINTTFESSTNNFMSTGGIKQMDWIYNWNRI